MGRLAALAVVVALIVLAGWYVRDTQRAIGQLEQQRRATQRTIGELERQRDASCKAFQSVGEYPLPETATNLGRRIVTTHADAARILGCGQ